MPDTITMEAQRDDGDNDDCLVATCAKCGRVVFVTVTAMMDKGSIRHAGKFAADPRYTLTHVTAAVVRKMAFRCECPKAKP